MQPCDVLTIKAVLQEAKPLLLNRKVEKVQQLGRDEIVLTLRSRLGINHFLVSAHAALGRLCLVNPATALPGSSPPGFCMLMRKQLTAATLVGVEQMVGERIVDIVFSCINEVGAPSIKILTVEIMGRHSNLIFWDKESEKIVAASHVVTSDMSRKRQVAPGLKYVRPERQARLNIFKLTQPEFEQQCQRIELSTPADQWLVSTFAGLGRHLAQEIVAASGYLSVEPGDLSAVNALWDKIQAVRQACTYQPAMRFDLDRYTVLSWLPGIDNLEQWKKIPSVNDMIEEYYRAQGIKERFHQLKDRLSGEVKSQTEKLQTRLTVAAEHLGSGHQLDEYKKSGDLILSNINHIAAGQTELVCDDFYAREGTKARIVLNPNLTPSQNAQMYYRQFAKLRARQSAAIAAKDEVDSRMAILKAYFESIQRAGTSEELEPLAEAILGRKDLRKQSEPARKKPVRQKLLNVTSCDGWTIYLGRNRHENDELINKLAQPQDIWMHVLGQGGAHVLIRVPSTKQEPPVTTLREAAQLAARLSKAGSGGKVRVVYTYCRHVRKIGKDNPGLVRYENEKTLEVDTSSPMPAALKKLFAQKPHSH